MKYDIIVAGGGLSGTAASVAAAREGKKVLLIEKSGSLGGAACNNYVNPFMPYKLNENGTPRNIADGIFTEILTALDGMGGLCENKSTFNEEILKIVLDRMTAENNVTVLFHAFILNVSTKESKITSVSVGSKSGIIDFEADYFIDATGDADIAAMSGCPFVLGRAEDNLCQPMTLCFRIANVDVGKAFAVLPEINRRYAELKSGGKIKNPREDVLMFGHFAPGILHLNSTRIVKKSPVDVFDLSRAEVEAREQMWELYTFLRDNFAEFKNSTLLSSAPEIGVRESRKIIGKYVLTVDDIKNCTKFDDAIAACNYDIDIHNPDGSGTSHYYFKDGTYYTIPYRALLPQKITNLLVAGRCISSEHEAQASFRIMPICCALGQAAGTACAAAHSADCSVNDVNISTVRDILRRNNAFIG